MSAHYLRYEESEDEPKDQQALREREIRSIFNTLEFLESLGETNHLTFG